MKYKLIVWREKKFQFIIVCYAYIIVYIYAFYYEIINKKYRQEESAHSHNIQENVVNNFLLIINYIFLLKKKQST